MKKMKTILAATFALTGLFAVTSCGGNDADYTIGILQIMTHDSLDDATQGFKDAITANLPEGKTVEFVYKNPESDESSKLTMATQLVRNCDLVLGNATPSALALKAAAVTEGKNSLPILFTSVTDPVDAGLVDTLKNPGGNITGTSDINPISKQMDMIFDFEPSVDKVGFLYNATESNSKVQCDEAIDYLSSIYPTVATEVKTVSEQSQINATVSQLVSDGCDTIYVPTDNLMASNMTTISNVTTPRNVTVVTGASGMVTQGGTLSIGISYYELGVTTGEMASEILFEGKSPSTIEVLSQTDVSKFDFVYNEAAMSAMNKTFSQDFLNKYNKD